MFMGGSRDEFNTVDLCTIDLILKDIGVQRMIRAVLGSDLIHIRVQPLEVVPPIHSLLSTKH
jgi:hypothetical protein